MNPIRLDCHHPITDEETEASGTLPKVPPPVSDGASTVSLLSRMLVTFWRDGVCWGLVTLQGALTAVSPVGSGRS